ncbi:hypothetical protein ABT300_08355 [Streptomyces sp. NPDC001027]|uniref:hypothetical protein n=1 Tax=Streptomyces sp. NPDC001027 TaxID=3154771 RepID=UPI00332B8119
MPRPTVAQLTYGSCTVIFSTLAMLLLSQTSSGPGIAVVVVAAVALGVLVAMTVPTPKPPRAPVARSAANRAVSRPTAPVAVPAHTSGTRSVTLPVPASVASAPEPVREPTAP